MQADFFANLFGNSASASTNFVTSDNTDKNSQNVELLQANVSQASIIQEKQDKKNKVNKENSIVENKNISILSENALLASTGPAGVSDGTDEDTFGDISVYVVRKGDSLAQIAEMFEVTSDTIRWSNDIKAGEKLKEGDILLIPPVSGVIHTVAKGQTLKTIAKLYKVEVADITGFNDISEDSKLEIGDELIIPDGEKTESNPTKITPNVKNKDYYKKYAGNDLGGYFTNPVPQYVKRTQGIHGKNGTDLAAPIGTPIVAAAGGTVLLARNGWNGAYGNMVIIKHPNGTETLYAHLSKIATHTGNSVSKGEIIGYMGSTGRSTGSHLHFEVHGAKNFTIDLPIFRK